MIRIAALLVLCAAPSWAQTYVFPAPSPIPKTDAATTSGGPPPHRLVIYSSLDERLAAPLIFGFQQDHPQLEVQYHEMLTAEIAQRVISETRAGQATADFVFSSAMDLQVKLINDGYARPVLTPQTAAWPRWANWRDTGYALTYEPAVFVYHRPSFAGRDLPDTRAELLHWLQPPQALPTQALPTQALPTTPAPPPQPGRAPPGAARIGTYDIEESGVGYLFLARDADHFRDIWALLRAMGRAGVETFGTSEEILARVADGRLAMGYNILGSYAADFARSHRDLGLVLPRDYTIVASRIGLVPRAAAAPDLGGRFLAYMMSDPGQMILTEDLRLPAVSEALAGRNRALAIGDLSSAQLRPIAVGPGLLAYLDQARRQRMIASWRAALGR